VFIEGNNYATNFDLLIPPMAVNMVYAFHKYWSETTKATIQYLLNIRDQYDVPLWLGESGENSNTWFRETVDLMEINNIGWNWWTHKKIATITSPYSAILTPDYQVILDYLENGQSKPSFEDAREALFGMAENLEIEKCEYHPDVVAALFDNRFNSSPVPYTTNQIPGTLNAVDFDIGANGVASSDVDYKRVRWDIWQPWNTGGAYRNDGVDIERSTGSALFPFNIGWTEAGEWIIYTVEITTTGTYDAFLTAAATSDKGRAGLYLDDTPLIADIRIPNTGGYQNWREISAGEVSLPEGTHRLKLTINAGSINLNRLRFVLKNSGNLHILNDTCLYGQNFPNPFNEGTTIPVVLNRAARIEISIFNALGEKVRTLIADELREGPYEFKWDGTNDHGYKVASGPYIYKLAVNDTEAAGQMMLVK
jgi:endoglucanase